MAFTNIQTRSGAVGSPGASHKVALSVVTTLFFMWGFVTVLNDVLVPHLKSIFDLTYTRVMLIQFSFFSAYFLFSIPSAKVIDWIGYKKTMVVGLFTMGLGALLFITLGIAKLGPLTGDGSGLLVMAIVGGAIIPVLQGALADRIGIHHAFILPVLCYLYIAYYAFRGSRPVAVA